MLVFLCALMIIVLLSIWHFYPDSRYFKKYTKNIYKRKAPGLNRYESYQHPSDEQHRTAEQFNWQSQNRLTLLTVIFAAIAAAFAFLTFYQTKRQADIAQQAFIENDRPIIDIVTNSLDFLGDRHGGHPTIDFLISNIGNKPGFIWFAVTQITLTDSPAPANDAFNGEIPCGVVLGNITVNVGMALKETCQLNQIPTGVQRARLIEGSMQMYFHGLVKYRSPAGTMWAKGLEYFWQPPIKDRQSYLQPLIDPASNFDRQIKSDSD